MRADHKKAWSADQGLRLSFHLAEGPISGAAAAPPMQTRNLRTKIGELGAPGSLAVCGRIPKAVLPTGPGRRRRSNSRTEILIRRTANTTELLSLPATSRRGWLDRGS